MSSVDVFEKIAAQQGKERTAVWMVGEQLKDIIRYDHRLQELVSMELDNAGMSLASCEEQIHDFADKQRTGNFSCVTPAEAENIIREFYGLGPSRGATSAALKPQTSGKLLNLEDFLDG